MNGWRTERDGGGRPPSQTEAELQKEREKGETEDKAQVWSGTSQVQLELILTRVVLEIKATVSLWTVFLDNSIDLSALGCGDLRGFPAGSRAAGLPRL